MFRRLKLKLTLINVTVLTLVIACLMVGIYSLMVRAITGQSEEQLRLIAENAGSIATNPNLRTEKYLPKDFYAKVDREGNIFETSKDLPISKDQLQLLVQRALAQPKSDTLQAGQNLGEYRYLKAPLTNTQGSILVFLGTSLEKLLLGHLIAAFVITGVGGIALTLFCSLFMANKALIPIQKSWETQRNFVGDASHELRTPLTVIQTNLDIVLDNPQDRVESQMIWLENIQIETKLMAKLVDDLLFLARTNSPQGLLTMEYFRLDLALTQFLTPFKPLADQKGISVNATLAPEINFHGDQTRIKQLVAILIDNAIKYTPPGGNITLRLKDTINQVQLIISDTGEGIKPEHLEKIFDRFYRVDTARSRESGGTGLGLSIAQWIVKEHKGTIKISSVPQKGTTVTVNFPK